MSFDLQKYNAQSKESFNRGEVTIHKSGSALMAMKSGQLIKETRRAEIQKNLDKNTSEIISQTSKFLKENRTDLVCIIDKSSSCSGLEGATSVGYNNLIEKEKKKGFPTKVTTVLFSDNIETICFREDIYNVKPLIYSADGWTALYDTMYDTITKVKESQKYDTIKSTRTVVAIMTDGLNILANGKESRHTEQQVRELVSECQDMGWEFIFLGALENAQEVASSLGIDFNNSVEVENNEVGMFNNFVSIGKALDDLRTYGKLSDSWSKESQKNKRLELR